MERKNKQRKEKIIFFASKLFGNHKNQAHDAGWRGLHSMRKLNLLVCFLRNEKVNTWKRTSFTNKYFNILKNK